MPEGMEVGEGNLCGNQGKGREDGEPGEVCGPSSTHVQHQEI